MEDRYPKATDVEVERILGFFDARKMVVGHSEVDSVMGLYGDKVFAIDVPVEEIGGFQGLLFEKGRIYRVNADGTRKLFE